MLRLGLEYRVVGTNEGSEVYKGVEKATGFVVALKKIIMNNEKEGVSWFDGEMNGLRIKAYGCLVSHHRSTRNKAIEAAPP